MNNDSNQIEKDAFVERRKKNTVAKNMGANFVLRVWLTLANFLFVPFYISFLGEETYGLITFFATLQTVLNIIAIGLSKALRREFASKDSSFSVECKYKLFRSVELIFIALSLTIVIVCFFGRGLICKWFLNIEDLDRSVVETTVFLMGVSIALQLISGMFQGCLFGLERQVEADIIQFSWSFLKNVGVILLLWLFNIDIIWFYLWYIFLDFIYLVVLRFRVTHYANPKHEYKWGFKDISNVKKVIPYALSLLFMSLCSIAVDKLIISNSFSLTVLGAYNTVSNLGNFVLIVSTSAGLALFSRFAFLKSEGNTEESRNLFFKVNKRVNIIVICLGAFLAFFSKELVLVWTGSEEITDIISKAGFFVVLALTFNSSQQMSYEYLLSNGIVKLDNIRSLATFVSLIVFEPIAIKLSGFYGACVAFLIINLVFTILYLLIVNFKYLKRNALKGLLVDFLLPLCISGCFGFGFYRLAMVLFSNVYLQIALGATGGLFTLLLLFLILDRRLFIDAKKIFERGEK